MGEAAEIKAKRQRTAHSPIPKLVYFAGLGGRAEPIVILLKLAKVEFEYERYSFSDPSYAEAKAAGEFSPTGGLPVWIEGGRKYWESNAILRMLGARYGFYAQDPHTMWEIDICLERVEQAIGHAGKAPHSKYMVCVVNGQKASPDIEQGMLSMYAELTSFAEERLQAHGKLYLAGTDTPTIADCRYVVQFTDSIYNDACRMENGIKSKIKADIDSKPCLKRWIEETMMPLLADHLASRSPPMW